MGAASLLKLWPFGSYQFAIQFVFFPFQNLIHTSSIFEKHKSKCLHLPVTGSVLIVPSPTSPHRDKCPVRPFLLVSQPKSPIHILVIQLMLAHGDLHGGQVPGWGCWWVVRVAATKRCMEPVAGEASPLLKQCLVCTEEFTHTHTLIFIPLPSPADLTAVSLPISVHPFKSKLSPLYHH